MIEDDEICEYCYELMDYCACEGEQYEYEDEDEEEEIYF